MERYGTGSGTTRPTPAQLPPRSTSIYQPRSAFLSKLADWSESRLPAGWQLASASLPSNITAVPQQATTVSGAVGNLPQVEREGGLQAIHSQTASWQQPSASLPSHNKVGSSFKCCRHRLPNTITGLGLYVRKHVKSNCTCSYIYIY